MTRNSSSYGSPPAKLPALPTVRVQDPSLQRFIDAVRESLEVRAGSRGDKFERSVTLRDLVQLGLLDAASLSGPSATLMSGGGSTASSQSNGAVLVQTGTKYTSMDFDAFARLIADTRLFKSITQSLSDPTRFDDLPDAVRSILKRDIAAEAALRGADIRRMEEKIQSATLSSAIAVQEVTAALGTSLAGVRETAFASADLTTATAGKVTQIRAALGDPATFSGAGVTLEETMFGSATTEALRGQYTMKIGAGGKIAGFGLAVDAPLGAPVSSAFIVQADKFAIMAAGDSLPDPLNPPLSRVPFGIDVANNTIYINGAVRINTGGGTGPRIDSLSAGASVAIVFAYKRSAVNLTSVWNASTNGPAFAGTKTYDYTTKAFTTALDSSWTTAIPAGTDPLYVTAATVSSATSTAAVLATDWAVCVKLVENGAAGADGLNSATVTLYQRTATSTPPTFTGVSPTNNLTYTFSTGLTTGTPPGSWTLAIPSTGGAFLWTVRATASNTTPTDLILPGEFGAVQALAQDGAGGSPGAAGQRGTMQLYRSNVAYVSGYAGYSADATSYISSQATTNGSTPTTPINGDTVTFSNTLGTYTTTRTWSGSAWVLPGVVIDGSLLVTGAITTGHLNAAISLSTSGYVKAEGLSAISLPTFATGTLLSRNVAIIGNSAAISANVGADIGIMGVTAQSASGNACGVFGYASGGVTGYGVVGRGMTAGVYAIASGSNWGLYSEGKAWVQGRLDVTGDFGINGSIACNEIQSSGHITKGKDAQGADIRIKTANSSAGVGVILRNDGTDFYIMGTASGAADGTWSSARPFRFNFSTGVTWHDILGLNAAPVVAGGNVATFAGTLPTGVVASTNKHMRIQTASGWGWIPIWME
jgi:hypothetical protein